MKILLVGEYNASHKTLKDGLVKLGHDVTVVGLGDGFKKRLVDVNFTLHFSSGLPLLLKKVIYKLFRTDLTSLSIKKQFYAQKELFMGNDIVQLINENSFQCVPKIEKQLLSFIFDNNPNIFLLSCGTDHISVQYAFDKKFDYSILTPYFEKQGDIKQYMPITKYLRPDYIDLHHYIFNRCKGVIASDLDYHIPLQGHPKYLGMVPNPINLEEINFMTMDVTNKIVIFHGINNNNYYKKGNYLFEQALELVNKTHAEKIDVITLRSVPYAEYIQSYDRAHIVLDQVFAYDQGFNALEAMAKGKVVFTGAEKEWLDYYSLEEDTVAINALPKAEAIAAQLIWLIDNPSKITEIGENARAFIEKEHDYIKSSKAYFDAWEKALV